MNYLEKLVDRLYKKEGESLTKAVWLLPTHLLTSRLNTLWAQKRGKIGWGLTTYTWAEFLYKLHPLALADELTLLEELYPVALPYFKINSFTRFSSLGREILSLFQRVDSNLLDPKKVLKIPIDGPSGKYWQAIKEEKKSITDSFFTNWAALYPIYQAYSKKLLVKKLVYLGLHYRQAVEKIKKEPVPKFDKIIGIHLHPLSSSQQEIFRHMATVIPLELYYTTDAWYMESSYQEAGYHLRDYVEDPLLGKNLQPPYRKGIEDPQKKVTFLSSPTQEGEVEVLKNVLHSFKSKNTKVPYSQIAIILPDTQLLGPLLDSLSPYFPLSPKMGYPFVQTPLYSFLQISLSFQEKMATDSSELMPRLEEEFKILFQNPSLSGCRVDLSQLLKAWQEPGEKIKDLLFPLTELLMPRSRRFSSYWEQMYRALLAFQNQGKNNSLSEWEKTVMAHGIHFISRLSSIKVWGKEHPREELSFFEKEAKKFFMPLKSKDGGILIVDFPKSVAIDNPYIFILSMNEGICPRIRNFSTLLPNSWYKEAGFPPQKAEEADASYIFYKLVHQASHIWLSYCEGVSEGKISEKSRYLWQLSYESNIKIEDQSYWPALAPLEEKSWSISKNSEVLTALGSFQPNQKRQRVFTPSAINTYLDCPRCFYLQYIAKIPQPPITDDKTNRALFFGSVFHEVMRLLYNPHVGKALSSDQIRRLYSQVPLLIEKAVLIVKNKEKKMGNKSIDQLETAVLERLVAKVLSADEAYAPFTILGVEFGSRGDLDYTHTLPDNRKLKLGGVIDRLDRKEDTLRLIDYKSGSWESSIPSISSLFQSEKPQRNRIALQLFWYSYLYAQKYSTQGLALAPTVFTPMNLFVESPTFHFTYSKARGTVESISDVRTYLPFFQKELDKVLSAIYNPALDFTGCSTEKGEIFSRYPIICQH